MEQNKQEKEKQFIVLPLELANAILGYLGKKPFEEVTKLITGVQQNGSILSESEWKHAGEEVNELRRTASLIPPNEKNPSSASE